MGRLSSSSRQFRGTSNPREASRGFTLLELIVVIGIIAFLSNVVLRQISTGLEQKNLESSIDNVGIYFSNASRLARASGQWVYVVVNVDPDSEGYLRQMGTYQWFAGEEPGESDNYVDINGNGRFDQDTARSGANSGVKGWMIDDPKGYWLPNKIYFDLRRSGPAQFIAGDSSFRSFEPHTSEKKYLYFSMKHQNPGNSGDKPEEITGRGRLPFFLDRSAVVASRSGENQILNNNQTGQQNIGVDPELASELKFSTNDKAREWILFAFDRQGRYINIKSGEVLGTGAPQHAQQDFVVLAQGYIDPGDASQIRGLNNPEPEHAAFLLHRNGNYTKAQDDAQIPSAN